MMEVKQMTYSVTTRGLQELGQLRSRLARDFGIGRINWSDFEFISTRLEEIEGRLIEMTANDPRRLAAEARRDGGTVDTSRSNIA